MIRETVVDFLLEPIETTIDGFERRAVTLCRAAHQSLHPLKMNLHSMFEARLDLSRDFLCDVAYEYIDGWIDHDDDGLIVDSGTQYQRGVRSET